MTKSLRYFLRCWHDSNTGADRFSRNPALAMIGTIASQVWRNPKMLQTLVVLWWS